MSYDNANEPVDGEFKTTAAKPEQKTDEKGLVKAEPKKGAVSTAKNTDELPITEAAKILFAAGMARTGEDYGKILVKLSFGRSIGLSDVAAINGLSLSPNGALVLSAANMLALIQRSGKYKFKYKERNDKICSLEVSQRIDGQWESMGVPISYSWEDAVRAGLSNKATYKSYPRQMLTARAIADVFRTCCADVAGVACYTPEELPDSNYRTDPDTMEMVPEDSGPKGKASLKSAAAPPPDPKPPKDQLDRIKKMLTELGAEPGPLYGHFGVKGPAELTLVQAEAMEKLLLERKKVAK